MRPRLREVVIALGVVLLVWFGLFSRSMFSEVRGILYVTVLALPFVLNVIGWRRWRSVRNEVETTRLRKSLGALGLVTNTLSLALICTVVVVFSYRTIKFIFTPDHPAVPPIEWMNATNFAVCMWGCFAVSVLGLGAGILGPVRIRLQVALSSFVLASIIFNDIMKRSQF